VLVGIPAAIGSAAWFTLVQLEVADEMRARSMGVVMVLEAGGMLIGAAIAGNLTDRFGVINVLTGQGLGYVLAAALFALLLRRIPRRTVEAAPAELLPAA
jgi:hypothetical protein